MYRWEGGPALVQTVDFFTPIVDDPYLYGQIAAANAVSDIYAMGGRPLTALAIAAFPKKGLDRETMTAIFRGGYDKLAEAGVALLGGHTVQDEEIKFGYAVTGAIDPDRILANTGARPGDRLILTKPLGTGIVGTAIKFDRAPADLVERAVLSMRTLNKAAAQAIRDIAGVHACTDVTGFGLVGHGSEMAAGSGVTLVIDSTAVPLLAGVLPLVAANRAGGLISNEDHFGPGVERGPSVDPDRMNLLFDPQTSGGLLISVAADSSAGTLAALSAAGVDAADIGWVDEGASRRLVVR